MELSGASRPAETSSRRGAEEAGRWSSQWRLDIETFVEARGRKELVSEVRKQIDALGIEYLYLQFVSVTGRIMGKGIPADHWESIAEKGFQLVYGATMNLFLNRRGEYLGYGPEAAELVGIPEPETFMQLPWDKRVARMWCTLFRNREEREEPGAFLTADARGNLRRIHDQFKKDHGLELRHGTEPEMMWLKKGEDGAAERRLFAPLLLSHRPVREPAPRLHAGHRLLPEDGPRHDPGRSRGFARPARAELHLRRLRCGPPTGSPTYRQICAQVAREFDIIACFMCKPFMGVSANGCHHNISLWKGGKDEMKALGNDPKKLPGMKQNYIYRRGGDQHLHARHRRHPAARQDRPEGDRRHRRSISAGSPPSAARPSTPIAGCGTPASGRRSSPTGASRTARRACASRRPAASNTAPSTPW